MTATYYKSIEWWSITVMAIVDVLNAIRWYSRTMAADKIWHLVILLVLVSLAWTFFLSFRIALKNCLQTVCSADVPEPRCTVSRDLLAVLNKRAVQLCTVALFLGFLSCTL